MIQNGVSLNQTSYEIIISFYALHPDSDPYEIFKLLQEMKEKSIYPNIVILFFIFFKLFNYLQNIFNLLLNAFVKFAPQEVANSKINLFFLKSYSVLSSKYNGYPKNST